jgi:hypothetical protein
VQIGAGEIEAEFVAQQPPEAEDVIVRFREGVGHQVDAAVAQLGQGPIAGLVAVGDGEAQRRPVGLDQLPQPAALARVRAAQGVVGTLGAGAEPGADQHAVAEPQPAQVLIGGREEAVVELGREGGEQLPEAGGGERVGVLVGEPAQVPQGVQKQGVYLDGAAQDRFGIVQEPAEDGVFRGDGRHGQVVQPPDRVGVRQAVAQDALPVADGVRIGGTRQQDAARHIAQEVVAAHGVQQRVQVQVLAEHVGVHGRRLPRVVTRAVQQVGLHDRAT